jgi:hypothetical protein
MGHILLYKFISFSFTKYLKAVKNRNTVLKGFFDPEKHNESLKMIEALHTALIF